MQNLKLPYESSPFRPEDFLVLVVDDVRQNLKVVGTMLDQVGYQTTFSTSGYQALERVEMACPDLIILDLMMPGISGLDVCQTLMSNPKYREIPVIFLTASHRQDHLLKAFEVGAVDYVTKPFNAAELLARVRTHLELKHTRDQLRRALTELQRMATTDFLTGTLNRWRFFEAVQQEFERSRRYGKEFALLMIDIDRFKQINDTHGHLVGDEVLKRLAAAIQQSLRQVDYFGRYGGEEFSVLLPETELEQAQQVGDRLRSLVSSLEILVDEQVTSITVSIGITTYDPKDVNIDAVFERADQALYQAKRTGRNRCCVYSEHPPALFNEPQRVSGSEETLGADPR